MDGEQHERQLSKKERREMRREEKRNRVERAQSSRSTKRIITWAIVVAIVGGAVFGVIKLASSPGDTGDVALSVTEVSADDWTKGGGPDAPITLIEYSDLQCPACGAYFPILKQLTAEFEDSVQFVYRHFPITRIHPNAELAARAAEAAGAQGKFWEMHDKIFETQQQWSQLRNAGSAFRQIAGELKLDLDKYDQDIKSDKVRKKVSAQYQSGVRSGVNSTPSFFLNGKKIQNPRTPDEFRALILTTLASAQITTSTTTTGTATTTLDNATTTP